MKKGVSVVIPAYNEENFLGTTVASLRDSFQGSDYNYEILVCDNGSTDETVSLATSLGCRVVSESERNIGKVRNTGASFAQKELLLFVDADSIVTPKLLASALKMISKKHKRLVVSLIEWDNYPTLFSNIIRLLNFFYVTLQTGGSAFMLISKEDFEQLGGFDITKPAYEDFFLIFKVKRTFGLFSVGLVLHPIITSARKFKSNKYVLILVLSIFIDPLRIALNQPLNNVGLWYGEHAEKSRR